MRLAYKIWLDNEGKAFGDGPCELLSWVSSSGSLAKASTEMGMSYNKAWRLMREMESRLGFQLIRRQAGGPAGGGSQLTPEAEDLLQRFTALKQEAAADLESLFQKHFPDAARAAARAADAGTQVEAPPRTQKAPDPRA